MTVSPHLGYEDESLEALDEMPTNVPTHVELGQTGLRRTGGYIDEEFLPQLRGRKAVQIFREMETNDPIVGALLFAIDRLLRQVEWRVEAAGDAPEDKEAAEFVEQCMEDMSHTWDDLISEILTMLPYGWAMNEICYKRRVGPWEEDPLKKSQYTDGKIGWRKMPLRAQETLLRWVFDDNGSLKGMIQMAPPSYRPVPLPIEKCLLFRPNSVKNNPEGRSILRNAYRPWYMKKRLEEIEAIGAERDLAGMPVGRVPADYLNAQPGTDKAKMVEAYKRMVRSVRRDEQEGIVLPTLYDQETKQPLFDFELLSSGGTRAFDTSAIIQRYEQRMLMTVLADFILVGHESVGSYAMHTDKSGLFRTAINSIARAIADVFNRNAIPRLFKINAWTPEKLPKIVPNDVDPPDLTQLGQFMGQMAQAGVVWFPDAELEKFVRDAARLPQLSEEAEAALELESRQADVMRVAQQRMEMLGMQMEAQQGALGLQQQQMQMEQPQPDPSAVQDTDIEIKRQMAEQDMRHKDEAHKTKLQIEQERHKTGLKTESERNKQSLRFERDKGKQELTYSRMSQRQRLLLERQKAQQQSAAKKPAKKATPKKAPPKGKK
jgi:hypothetical protein